jgi:hypothetical protein
MLALAVGKWRFTDQIVTTNISAGGDSGSLVVAFDNVAVGLLFAGSSVATIVKQIENVRALLRVEVAEQILWEAGSEEGRMPGTPVRGGIAPEENQKADHREVHQFFGKEQSVIEGKEMEMQQQSSLQGMAAEEAQAVKEQEVRQLFKATEGITPQNLTGTGFTYRHDWGDRNGQRRQDHRRC